MTASPHPPQPDPARRELDDVGRRGRMGWKRWMALVMALVLLGTWVLVKSPVDQVVSLPDGGQLRLEAVTFGTDHSFRQGRLLNQVVARVLPSKWEAKLGVRTTRHQSVEPCLMVWCEWAGPVNPTNSPPNWAGVSGGSRESEPIRPVVSIPSSGSTVFGWAFTNFPRREREIRVRVYNRDNAFLPALLAEFKIANLARKNYPEWTARPLERSVTDGGLTFRLLSLESSEELRRGRQFWGRIAPWTAARFRVERNGETLDSWEIDALEITDATGNRTTHLATTRSSLPGELGFVFNSVLWTSEAAVDLKVGFGRRTGFASEETWTIPAVVVPGTPYQSVVINTQKVVQGVTIRVAAITRLLSAMGRAPGPAEVMAELIAAPEDIRLMLIEAKDERGTPMKLQPERRLRGRSVAFGVVVTAGVTRLDLTFAVDRTRFVLFERVPVP